MTANIKHRPKYVPTYVKRVLNYVINYYVMPVLYSTTSVYTNPHFKIEDTSSLDISLVKNDTIRLHLRTPRMSYVLNDVKLPTVLKSLPVGTSEIPMLAKMHHLIRRKLKQYVNLVFYYFLEYCTVFRPFLSRIVKSILSVSSNILLVFSSTMFASRKYICHIW